MLNNNFNFSLDCSADTFLVDHPIKHVWKKNKERDYFLLEHNDHYSMSGLALTINNVSVSDSGQYMCELFDETCVKAEIISLAVKGK